MRNNNQRSFLSKNQSKITKKRKNEFNLGYCPRFINIHAQK